MTERTVCITVYCSSSGKVAAEYRAAAAELGAGIAKKGWSLVYGGNRIGCMGALADSARAGGARVIGITPRLFLDKGIGDERCDELIVADSMRHRKQLMESRGDAFVALPGGLGTMEEIFEIIVGRSLGCHDKPIVLLNVLGYYNPMLAMLDHGIEHKFINPQARRFYDVVSTVQMAIAHLDGMLSGKKLENRKNIPRALPPD